MRISDWSSDVCSSDLDCRSAGCVRCAPAHAQRRAARGRWVRLRPRESDHRFEALGITQTLPFGLQTECRVRQQMNPRRDRKSVVSGKSVSVRVDLGCRRIINKKKKTEENKNTLA